MSNTATATDAEALTFIENRKLMGRGIGFVDVHLLASVALFGAAHLWTHDQRLATIASKLKLNYTTRQERTTCRLRRQIPDV